jgi:hypothetical protein
MTENKKVNGEPAKETRENKNVRIEKTLTSKLGSHQFKGCYPRTFFGWLASKKDEKPIYQITIAEKRAIVRAIYSIGKNCNWAKTIDNIGFDKPHADFFNPAIRAYDDEDEMILHCPSWWIVEGFYKLAKYTDTQLYNAGINYESLRPACLKVGEKR